MMIFFSILFSLLIINVVLLVFSVNKLPKVKTQNPVYNKPETKNLKSAEGKVKDKEYDVVLKEAI